MRKVLGAGANVHLAKLDALDRMDEDETVVDTDYKNGEFGMVLCYLTVADPPLPAEQYVEAPPNHCPVCGCGTVEGASVDIEGHKAYQEVTCTKCHSVWYDVYRLIEYDLTYDGLRGESY